jgi:pseudaminic acid biosynthesis-associated methylase
MLIRKSSRHTRVRAKSPSATNTLKSYKVLSSSFRTPQEEFWAGDFGTAYAARNADPAMLASNIALFAKVLSRAPGVRSVCEFGANIGLNLLAIRAILPNVALCAVEVNPVAFTQLSAIPGITAHHGSLLDFAAEGLHDLTLSKGVLIHVHPDQLENAYLQLYRYTRRYICIAEYYNPSAVSVSYRGHADRLFKRDFAGEMLDKYPDLRLLSYGFVYRRDPVHPMDDVSWFLLERC